MNIFLNIIQTSYNSWNWNKNIQWINNNNNNNNNTNDVYSSIYYYKQKGKILMNNNNNNDNNSNNSSIITTNTNTNTNTTKISNNHQIIDHDIGDALKNMGMKTQEEILLYNDIRWHDLDKKKYYILIPFGYLSVRFLVYPASLVKTQAQTRDLSSTFTTVTDRHTIPSKGQSWSQWNIIRQIWTKEGIMGFYKGFGVSLFNLLSAPIYTTSFEISRDMIHRFLINRKYNSFQTFSDNNNNNNNGNELNTVSALMGGITATTLTQVVQTPIDVISQRRMVLQAGKDIATMTPIRIAKDIIQTDGVLGLWKGMLISIGVYAPTSGLVWSIFTLNRDFLYRNRGGNTKDVSNTMISQYEQNNMNEVINNAPKLPTAFGIDFVSGGVAGIITAWITMPIDTARTRKQVLEKRTTPTWRIVRNIYYNEGIRGLWIGVSARMTSLGISCACLLSSYELVKRMSTKDKE